MANQYQQLPVDFSVNLIDDQPVTTKKWSKKGVALIGGSCLVLLAVVAVSTSTSTLPSTSAADLTNLIGLSPSLRSPSAAMAPLRTELINSNPWAKYAIAAIEATQLDDRARDVSMRAMMANMDDKSKSAVVKASQAAVVKAEAITRETMPGAMAPIGFFDPFGFTTEANAGRLLYLREAELTHGRVCMLASLGFLVGEKYHPLFGGNLEMPSVFVPQEVPNGAFWPAIFLAIAIPEINRLKLYEWTYAFPENKDLSRVPGDLGFDPLGLKPKKADELRSIQEKEINNGRLAMVAAAGMIAQEWAFNEKIF